MSESYHGIDLRPLVADDAPRLYELIDDNRLELRKFWWEAATRSPADSASFVEAVNAQEGRNESLTRGIIHDQDGLIGVGALHTIDWQRRSSLMGYWIDKGHAGHGYATAAAWLLVAEAFDHLGLEELRIATRASNQASRAIALKLGFKLVEVADRPLWNTEDAMVPTAVYALEA